MGYIKWLVWVVRVGGVRVAWKGGMGFELGDGIRGGGGVGFR